MQEVQGVPDGADWYYGGGNEQECGQWVKDTGVDSTWPVNNWKVKTFSLYI